MSTFKPLLSSPIDFDIARWPMVISPKLDGIRCLVRNSQVVSRTLKLIPNAHVQALFGKPEFEGLDGELIVGSPTAPDCYNTTQSGVMKATGEPDVTFHVFDDVTHPHLPFVDRMLGAMGRVARHCVKVQMVPHQLVDSEDQAKEIYAKFLDYGYEGAMFRTAAGQYKMGRSTAREGILLKWKPLADSDAEVLGYFEQMQNNNLGIIDELGHTKRSSHAENKVGKSTLGGLMARDLETGIEFNVGIFVGATDKDRKAWWAERETLIGKKFKYQSLVIGVKEKPRHPRFLGWRDDV